MAGLAGYATEAARELPRSGFTEYGPDHDAMTLLDLAASGSSGGSGETAPVSPSQECR